MTLCPCDGCQDDLSVSTVAVCQFCTIKDVVVRVEVAVHLRRLAAADLLVVLAELGRALALAWGVADALGVTFLRADTAIGALGSGQANLLIRMTERATPTVLFSTTLC